MSTTNEAAPLPNTEPELASPVSQIDRERTIAMQLIWLAVPIIIGRIGWMGMYIVDTMMVGRFSTEELAFQSLAGNVVGTIFVPMMGLILGSLIFVSNAYGAGRFADTGAVMRRSIPYALGLGILLSLICLIGEPLLLLLGQKPEIAAGAGRVLQVYAIGVPLGLVQLVGVYFLEGIKRPVPAMVIVLSANLLNVFGNWLLVYGNLGFPALGAEGSAWTTNACRLFMTIATFAVIWFMADHERFGVRKKVRQSWASWGDQRRLGYAAGLSFGIEHAAFAGLVLFAGWMGEISVASMAITMQLFAVHFMVAAGFASATSVLVGNAWGQGEFILMRRIGLTGLALATGFLILGNANLTFGADLYAAIFSDDSAVRIVVAGLLPLAAWGLMFDGQQTVMANALRARRDNWFPTASHAIAYLVIMMPLAYVLAFDFGLGVAGLMWAILVASVISAASLVLRFLWLSRVGLLPVAAGE